MAGKSTKGKQEMKKAVAKPSKAVEKSDSSSESSSEEDDEIVTQPAAKGGAKAKSAFALLAEMEDGGGGDSSKSSGASDKDSDDDSKSSDDEMVAAKAGKKKPPAKAAAVKTEQAKVPPAAKDEKPAAGKGAKKGATGKKGGAAAQDEDDIDKILAELDIKKPAPPAAAAPPKAETEAAAPAEADTGAEVKTAAGKSAAEKRKEKRAKQKEGGKHEEDLPEVGAKREKDEATVGAADAEQHEGSDDEETAKGKKKKKKGKDDKEKDTKGKPGSKQVALMKEALKKVQEEEEKRRLAAEEEERKRREAEDALLEKIRKEEERKKKKREKEKERIQRQKEAGTFRTAEQKAKEQRAKEMVQQVIQGGGVVAGLAGAEPVAKQRPKYVDKAKLRRKQQQGAGKAEGDEAETGSLSSATEALAPPASAADSKASSPVGDQKELAEDVIESWDLLADQSPPKASKAEKRPASAEKTAGENGASPEKGSGSESGEESSEEESDEASTSSADEEEEIAENLPSEPLPVSRLEPAEQVPANETKEQAKARITARIKKRVVDAEAVRSTAHLRSPVICVLGHVDVGKTKILDKIRRTNVQEGEAGGITQQIGATRVPADAVREQAKMVKDFKGDDVIIPGLLIIDTPGHESFSNLRSRGSSLCDFAILVVDIMHGIEPQTLESIELLKSKKTPFIIALNKVDRLYEWKHNPHKDIRDVLKAQQPNTQIEFKDRVQVAVGQFAEQGLNVALFSQNADPNEYYSMVPVSAHTGDGMGNLMACLVQYVQKFQAKRLAFSDALQCTVLEVKALPGLGTTIDVILVNGRLRVGDTIVVPGVEGPIVTQIRELLMPQPLKEMRVKNPYEHYKELCGAQGIKILAKDLDKALAGLQLLVAHREDEIEFCKEEVAEALKRALQSINLSDTGVYVQASTLGSLEALLSFLRDSKIPYCGVNIGPVHKRDVTKASAMLEREESHYAVILAFDVEIEREAQTLANQVGVRIFKADIIYHLFDAFTKYTDDWKKKKRDENAHLAVFPCKLRILPEHIFNARNPLVMGVRVEAGIVKIGTPICVPSKEFIFLGNVSSIESNHKPVETARQGSEVCVKIENTSGDAPRLYGRHFDHEDLLMSRISRETIDVCKQYFRDELIKSDWQLIVELKKIFSII